MTKQSVLFLLGLCLCLAPVSGQVAFWQRFMGGSGFDIGKKLLMMEDGTLLIAGEVYSRDGLGQQNHSNLSDVVLLKYATQDVYYWRLTLGGSGMDELSDVVKTPDGGLVAVGTTDSPDGDFGPGKGGMDIWAVKVNSNGQIVWKRRFGGRGNDKGLAILAAQDGGYFIGGESGSLDGDMRSHLKGRLDSWIARLGPMGDLRWEKKYGGSANEQVRRIHELAPGNFLVLNTATSRDGDIKQAKGKKDVWAFRMNYTGDILWQASFGGEDNDDIHDSHIDAAGNVVVAGTSFSRGGDLKVHKGLGDFWAFCLTPEGQLKWSHSYGGSKADGADAIYPTRDGGYLLGGMTRSNDGDIKINQGYYDAWLVKLDANGKLMWERTMGYPGKDAFNSIIEGWPSGYMALGFAEQPRAAESAIGGHHGGADFWLINISDPNTRNARPFFTPTLLKGKVVDKRTGKPLAASITLTENISLEKVSQTNTNPSTGEFTLMLSAYGMSSIHVSSKDYLFYGENINMDTVIMDRKVMRKLVKLEEFGIGSKLVLGNIYFNPGQWEPLQASYAELERLEVFLRKNPRVRIEISGHTDNTGNTNDKQLLSENRARAIQKYLVLQGINQRRLVARGYGMQQPVASNATRRGRQLNRRVEFKVISL